QLRQGLEDFAKANGIDISRVAKLPGKGPETWGVSYKGMNQTVEKFGGPDFVRAHEIGHAIEDQHHFLDDWIRKPGNPLAGQAIEDQLDRLADLRGLGPKQQDYAHGDAEKAAVVFQAYVSARSLMAREAPDVLDRFEAFLAHDPKLSPLMDLEPGL